VFSNSGFSARAARRCTLSGNGCHLRGPLLALAAVVCLLWPTGAAAAPRTRSDGGAGRGQHWVETWSASPSPPYSTGVSSTGFTNQTVRETVHTSVGGPLLRLRLANTFGSGPLMIDDVSVAVSVGPGRIEPDTTQQVTFGAQAGVMIPRGARVVSDPVALRVRPDSDVTVSLYMSGATGPTTWHQLGQQTNYISTTGNHVDDASAAAYPTTVTSYFFLDGMDVLAPRTVGAVATLGDSITDGFNSTVDANHRYPNFLARRLLTLPRRFSEAVVNAGISGNRVLNDSECCGVNALARFDRDVLAEPGVRDVIVLEGINDIGFSQLTDPGTAPHTNVSAAQIIFGYQQLILQAHLQGLRIFGGTLLPFEGAGYADAAGEAKREAVNDWIRNRSGFDGIIDFDRATRDPAHPTRLLPAYDSGDHLHPNDAGYAAMAAAIRLGCLSLGGWSDDEETGFREDCTVSDDAVAARRD
jgi:lysophospholipase L1-like esterase